MSTTKLQMVLLGLIIAQGAGLNAMEKTKSSPRQPLSCSQEARMKDPELIAALNRSLEPKKEVKNYIYYETPCGSGRANYIDWNSWPKKVSFMAPYDHFPH